MTATRVQEWIERLREIAPALGIPRVEGLAEYVTADMDLDRLPAIWVLPVSHDVTREPPVREETWRYAVIIALRSARQRERDTRLLTGVEALCGAIREHLESWQAGELCGREIEYERGEGRGLDDAGHVFFWQQTYAERITLLDGE